MSGAWSSGWSSGFDIGESGMVEPLPLLYTSRDEVESVLSKRGIDLHIDDDDDGSVLQPDEEDYLDDAIYEATDTINIFAVYYDPADLSQSLWVRRKASYLAAHIISKRRGNSEIFCGDKDEIMAYLKKVLDGTMRIPRIKWNKSTHGPSMSNVVVDHYYGRRNIRTDANYTNVGTDGQYQDVDYRRSYSWW